MYSKAMIFKCLFMPMANIYIQCKLIEHLKEKHYRLVLQLAAVLDSLSSLVVLWRFSVRESQETNSVERERR